MIRLIFSMIFLNLLSSFGLQAQVQSKSFDLLLKSMLKKTVTTISVEKLKPDVENTVLLDARELKEYEVSHLKNAKYIGYDDFDISRLQGIDKNAPVVVYCSIGVRSEKIGEKLQKEGFTNVKNLYGSIFEWVNQGNPVYDSKEHKTSKVHAYNKKWGVWLKKGEKVF